jgi:hypothetical protein
MRKRIGMLGDAKLTKITLVPNLSNLIMILLHNLYKKIVSLNLKGKHY